MGTIAQRFESGEQSAQKGLFNNLVMLARVDGKVEPEEIALLTRIARTLSLTSEQVKEIIEHPDQYPMIPPVGLDERKERFIQFVKMISVDGVINKDEDKLASKYGVALGFHHEEIRDTEALILKGLRKGLSVDEIVASI